MSDTVCLKRSEWFVETFFPGIRRCKLDAFRIDKEIFKGKSKYQDIHVFESRGFGRILALDGIIQFSQSDEFIYHEVIAHIPLMTHPHPRRFLVVGGGDGGVLREAVKHPLKELYQVEIDQEVVGICKKYFPFVSGGAFLDKRLRVCFEDGKNFINKYKNFFEVIVVDSTDPVGPGKALFQGGFYTSVFNALTNDGIAIFQLGPFIDFGLIIKSIAKKLKAHARFVCPVRLPMPSYSCGSEYCFMLASKKIDPAKLTPGILGQRLALRLKHKANSLKYYSPQIHQASLVMPKIWRV